MKKLIALVCLGFVYAVSTPVFAGSQQDKMKGCNIEAKGMKGDERKAFMKKCLKKDYVLKSSTTAALGAPAAPATPAASTAAPAKEETNATAGTAAPAAKMSQKEKMKACNADAKTKGLKGDERKKFMSSCLKGSS